MKEDTTGIYAIATAMFRAGLTSARGGSSPDQLDPEMLRQAAIFVLGTVLEATPGITTRRSMREASEQAGREIWYHLVALRERSDAGEPRAWSPTNNDGSDSVEEREDRMDEADYRHCLHYLAMAERCMVEGADGWHLARLSMVIECLKEAYDARPLTTVPADTAIRLP
ncbi:hypothetical protein [Sphingomonas oryzagri]|uniref:Uncharacterized protein n=1 Tax=Sphingomonas oryzagri TaxID=3042314 RepID=A0ABT6N1R9_9SPHN|nr:hypothetical protein [Sphingomonas oryzagri]MDH7639225.1 hypothetical protein [Sphingomonas oryzagri]